MNHRLYTETRDFFITKTNRYLKTIAEFTAYQKQCFVQGASHVETLKETLTQLQFSREGDENLSPPENPGFVGSAEFPEFPEPQAQAN